MPKSRFEIAQQAMKGWSIDVETGIIRTKKGIPTTMNEQGYLLVQSAVDGKRVRFKQHQIIMVKAGIDPFGKTVNHLDGNKRNNALSNLEVITRKDNLRHAFENGIVTRIKRPFFDDSTVIAIRNEYSSGAGITELSRKYDSNPTTIYQLVHGKTYRGVKEDGKTVSK